MYHYIPYHYIQFHEEQFKLRTKEDHLKQLDELAREDDDAGTLSTKYGINSKSCLLDLNYVDICSGVLLPDIMHDVLEGALQYELKLLLLHCIEQGFFKVYKECVVYRFITWLES